MQAWPTLDPGKLIHEIQIWDMHGVTETDASGTVLVPVVVATAMASIEPIRGTDLIRSGQTTTQLFLTVSMWFQPGIKPDMQIDSETGSRYLIQSIEDIRGMHVVLILNCLGLRGNI